MSGIASTGYSTSTTGPMTRAIRPVEQLQMIFGYRNALLYPDRIFLPRIGELLTEQGAFKDPEFGKRLEAQPAGFVAFVEKVKGVKLRSAK